VVCGGCGGFVMESFTVVDNMRVVVVVVAFSVKLLQPIHHKHHNEKSSITILIRRSFF
jgi:hypothetical protein